MNTLGIIVSGSRYYTDYSEFEQTMDHILSKVRDKYQIYIIEGGARGADAMALRYAKAHDIMHIQVKANWAHYGRQAGTIRNQEMLLRSLRTFDKVALVAFPAQDSRGTRHMINISKRQGITCKIKEV